MPRLILFQALQLLLEVLLLLALELLRLAVLEEVAVVGLFLIAGGPAQ